MNPPEELDQFVECVFEFVGFVNTLFSADLDNLSIHDISNLRMVAKDAKKALSAIEKSVDVVIAGLEERALEFMQQQKMDTVNNEYANISKRKEAYPSVQDWPALIEYITENNAYQLFQRRLSKSAFDEVLSINCIDTLPGVEIFEKEIVKFSDRRNKAN